MNFKNLNYLHLWLFNHFRLRLFSDILRIGPLVLILEIHFSWSTQIETFTLFSSTNFFNIFGFFKISWTAVLTLKNVAQLYQCITNNATIIDLYVLFWEALYWKSAGQKTFSFGGYREIFQGVESQSNNFINF